MPRSQPGVVAIPGPGGKRKRARSSTSPLNLQKIPCACLSKAPYELTWGTPVERQISHHKLPFPEGSGNLTLLPSSAFTENGSTWHGPTTRTKRTCRFVLVRRALPLPVPTPPKRFGFRRRPGSRGVGPKAYRGHTSAHPDERLRIGRMTEVTPPIQISPSTLLIPRNQSGSLWELRRGGLSWSTDPPFWSRSADLSSPSRSSRTRRIETLRPGPAPSLGNLMQP